MEKLSEEIYNKTGISEDKQYIYYTDRYPILLIKNDNIAEINEKENENISSEEEIRKIANIVKKKMEDETYEPDINIKKEYIKKIALRILKKQEFT